ncbi:hypothetical protein K458DRAFT_73683 [Lentithecium fluviatile CBS 122367]|uniref:Uncharacterized protein n=1 Tax=Lentithecium fluviatile CBS 122367 TaxID=1168545 RepID=A0A6G1IVF8_9PLEO|nr:hypothetical protein K458DRAFT_73683 [Lentithecium fluviatile CBS 122367]
MRLSQGFCTASDFSNNPISTSSANSLGNAAICTSFSWRSVAGDAVVGRGLQPRVSLFGVNDANHSHPTPGRGEMICNVCSSPSFRPRRAELWLRYLYLPGRMACLPHTMEGDRYHINAHFGMSSKAATAWARFIKACFRSLKIDSAASSRS